MGDGFVNSPIVWARPTHSMGDVHLTVGFVHATYMNPYMPACALRSCTAVHHSCAVWDDMTYMSIRRWGWMSYMPHVQYSCLVHVHRMYDSAHASFNYCGVPGGVIRCTAAPIHPPHTVPWHSGCRAALSSSDHCATTQAVFMSSLKMSEMAGLGDFTMRAASAARCPSLHRRSRGCNWLW